MRSEKSKKRKAEYNRAYRKTEAGRRATKKHLESENYKKVHAEYNKKYRKKNREKLNHYNREYLRKYRQTKKGKEISRLSSIVRRTRLVNADGTHTLGEWENLKAQYNWACPCCGKREPSITLTADHIIPLSLGGSNNIENIQPLCRGCNSSKHTKITKY